MKVAFVVYRDSLGPVFGSLYAKPVELLRARGYDARIVCFEAIGHFLRGRQRSLWKRREAEFWNSINGQMSRLPVWPSRLASHIGDTLPIAFWLAATRSLAGPQILHCGGSLAAYHALKARDLLAGRRLRVVFHSWGPIADEYAYHVAGSKDAELAGRDARRYSELLRCEEYAYRNADAVVCISSYMQNYALEQIGVPESKLVQIPCYVDQSKFARSEAEREKLRDQMGWHTRKVVVFSGALHRWQKPEAIFEIFRHIKDREPRAFLLILTNHLDRAHALAERYGIAPTDISIRSVPFEEVADYLAAADLGLLTRGLCEAPSRVNLFSSPIKVPEYLSAGCPVVIGPGIGDMSNFVDQSEVGVAALASDGLADIAERACKLFAMNPDEALALRRRCVSTSAARFDIVRHIDAYEALYRLAVA